jgi:hypothetical protein
LAGRRESIRQGGGGACGPGGQESVQPVGGRACGREAGECASGGRGGELSVRPGGWSACGQGRDAGEHSARGRESAAGGTAFGREGERAAASACRKAGGRAAGGLEAGERAAGRLGKPAAGRQGYVTYVLPHGRGVGVEPAAGRLESVLPGPRGGRAFCQGVGERGRGKSMLPGGWSVWPDCRGAFGREAVEFLAGRRGSVQQGGWRECCRKAEERASAVTDLKRSIFK